MKLPLMLVLDHCTETGTTSHIVDAEGALIVEAPGPEATWRDLNELVNLANEAHFQNEMRALLLSMLVGKAAR